jgi:hypothetical protein
MSEKKALGHVRWRRCILHPEHGGDMGAEAWQLVLDGRVLLNAVAMTDLQDAVTPEDRRLIGESIAMYLSNNELNNKEASK